MSTEGKSFWLTAIQTVGFPIIACIALGWMSYKTIEWERQQMLPAIEANTQVLRDVKEELSRAIRTTSQAARSTAEASREVAQAVEKVERHE